MDRRTFVLTTGYLTAVSIAGCLGGGDDDGEGEDEPVADEGTTDEEIRRSNPRIPK